MKKGIFLLYLLLFSCALFGQTTKETEKPATVKKNTISFEEKGSGADYAIHYNRVLFQKPHFFLDADIGMGINDINRVYPTYNPQFSTLYSTALCLNIAAARNKGAYFFLGAGGTYGNLHPLYYPIHVPKGFLYPLLGIKYQPLNDNISFKFYFFPHYAKTRGDSYDPESTVLDMNLGVSLGYAFDAKKKGRKSAQNIDSVQMCKNAVFLQLFGESGIIGLGYSRILLQKRKFFWDIRGGINLNIGYIPPLLITSAGTSLNWGRKNHYFETGISYLPITFRSSEGRNSYMTFYKFVMPVIGYKVVYKHFFFRAHFAPIWEYRFLSLPFGGLSLGYAF